jgi:ribosomal protein L40E
LKEHAELRELPATNGRKRRMISTKCTECGAPVPVLARACGRCGASNPARPGAVAVAAGVAVLVIAAVGAIYAATRSQHPVAGERTYANPSTADGDVTWLTSALKECDEEASGQPGTLRFLVIPLRAEQKDMPDWRLIALGAIGNALMVAADDALGGLRRGTLRINADEYVFSVQDAGTKAVYKWSPSVGVKQFSTAEAQTARDFRVQIRPSQNAEAGWGDVYSRQNGACHWVPAIMGG